MTISWFNCWTRVGSCWLVSESCWLVSSSCWLVSSSCITIDLIGKQPVLFSCTFPQNSSGRLLLDFVEYLYLESFFVSLDKFVLASTINSHNFVIICLNKILFFHYFCWIFSLAFLKTPSFVQLCIFRKLSRNKATMIESIFNKIASCS